MRTIIVQNPMTYPADRPAGEIFTMPSLTVPDQTMSLQEILKRSSMGIPPNSNVVMFDDEIDEDDPEYLPDPKTLDFVDREQMVLAIKAELEEIAAKNIAPAELPPAGDAS